MYEKYGWKRDTSLPYCLRYRRVISPKLSFIIEENRGGCLTSFASSFSLACQIGKRYPTWYKDDPTYKFDDFWDADTAAEEWKGKFIRTSHNLKRRADNPDYAMPEEVHWLEHQWYVSPRGNLAKEIDGKRFVIRKKGEKYEVLWFGTPLPGLYDSAEDADEAAFLEYLMRINLGIIEFRKKLDLSIS